MPVIGNITRLCSFAKLIGELNFKACEDALKSGAKVWIMEGKRQVWAEYDLTHEERMVCLEKLQQQKGLLFVIVVRKVPLDPRELGDFEPGGRGGIPMPTVITIGPAARGLKVTTKSEGVL